MWHYFCSEGPLPLSEKKPIRNRYSLKLFHRAKFVIMRANSDHDSADKLASSAVFGKVSIPPPLQEIKNCKIYSKTGGFQRSAFTARRLGRSGKSYLSLETRVSQPLVLLLCIALPRFGTSTNFGSLGWNCFVNLESPGPVQGQCDLYSSKGNILPERAGVASFSRCSILLP